MRPSDEDTMVEADGRATDASLSDASPQELTAGALVGPYTVLRSIGRGGMGTVYAAYDETLDRRVALKILHPTRKDSSRLRVLREARALAKLNHPNVVAVYATGEHEDQLFIAMEFVDGIDLSAWRRRSEPEHASVLEAYRQAGLGLAAAHEAGLVHRDFKPGNAMIDAEGRVKVLDFGLARKANVEGTSDKPDSVSASVLSSDEITRVGSTVGTPAYMSPEQMMGLPTDARTDQFSYCVSLWEALFGVRPFQGATARELLLNTAAGEAPIPREPGSAAWTVPILSRGLSNDPDARWPDMQALLAALEPARPRSRRGAWLAGSVVVVAGIALAWQSSQHDAASCNDGPHAFATTWNTERRARVRAALSQPDRPYAEGVATEAIGAFDAYADAWIDARASACVDARDGGQSAELRDARYACLDRAKQSYGRLVGALEESGPRTLERVPKALESLPTLARCADVDHVLAVVPPPASASVAERVAELRGQLDEVRALRTLGHFDRAQESMDALDSALADVDYAPVRAEINLEGVRLASESQDGAVALRRADAAYLDIHGLDPATIIEVHLQLYVAYQTSERYEAAERELRVSIALAERWMPSDAELRLRTMNALGLLATAREQSGQARQAFAEAFALTVEQFGPESIQTAQAHLNLGAAQRDVQELDEALRHAKQARDIWTRTYGPSHPDVAGALNNIGTTLRAMGNNAEALAAQEEALEISVAAYGEDGFSPLMARLNVAVLSIVLGRLDDAQRDTEAVLRILEPTPSRFIRLQTAAHMHLGIIAMKKDEPAAARASLQRAVELNTQIHGSDSIPVAKVVAHLGNLEATVGNLETALAHYRRTLRSFRTATPPNPSDIADGESNVASVLAGLGRCDEAWPLLESGLEYWTPRLTPQSYFAEWLVTQHVTAAMCAGVLGKDADAEAYARQASSLQLAHPTDRFHAAKSLAALIVDDAAPQRRKQVADEAREYFEPAVVNLIDDWLERPQAAASRSRK